MSPEAIIRQAKSDLQAFGLEVSACVRMDWKQKHTEGIAGICYSYATPLIYLNPGLTGAALYRVVLHELGHALGLNDRRSGIMAYKRYQPVDYQQEPPTLAQRKAWSFEIAQEVLLMRKRQWSAAA